MQANKLYGKRIDYMYFFEESKKFIMFIEDCINSDENSMLYLARAKNAIIYGIYGDDEIQDIQMISNSDFTTLLRVLQNNYKFDFISQFVPVKFSENVYMSIKSSNAVDIEYLNNIKSANNNQEKIKKL